MSTPPGQPSHPSSYSATVLHPSEMAFLENLADKEGFLGGVFHEPLPASPQYILHTDNTSVSSATSSPLSVINTGQFPPFSWGAQQQHSSKPVCQGGKPAAPASPPSLPSTSLPPPPPSPPYSPPCLSGQPSSLSAIRFFLPGISFLQLLQAGGGGARLTTPPDFPPNSGGEKKKAAGRLSRIF